MRVKKQAKRLCHTEPHPSSTLQQADPHFQPALCHQLMKCTQTSAPSLLQVP